MRYFKYIFRNIFIIGIFFIVNSTITGCSRFTAEISRGVAKNKNIFNETRPLISEIKPNIVTNTHAETVYIKGNGFTQDSRLVINGHWFELNKYKKYVNLIDDKNIVVTLPRRLPVGKYDIRIATPTGMMSNKVTFTIKKES